MIFDAFIIGQGIAGSTLALKMTELGKRVKIFDQPDQNNCSSVAAGIFNPVTGKRQRLTWLAEDFFKSTHEFYPKIEKMLESKFFHPTPLYRILSSVEEVNNWSSNFGDDRYSSFIDEADMKYLPHDIYNNPFQSMGVKQGGWLDVNGYIKAVSNYFTALSAYESCYFDWESAYFNNGSYHYGDDQATHIIFCNGLSHNQLWHHLPFTPMKGEVLTIKPANPLNQLIAIGGCFLTPEPNGNWKAGSTYNWRDLTCTTTIDGKEEIEQKLKSFFKPDYQLVNHQVGIRPAVKDRKPMMGMHPSETNVYLFNGLGSKGVSMAPHLADMMLDLVFEQKPLSKETSLTRFL